MQFFQLYLHTHRVRKNSGRKYKVLTMFCRVLGLFDITNFIR